MMRHRFQNHGAGFFCRPGLTSLAAAWAISVLAVMPAEQALAQAAGDSVVVDLSVLSDGGRGPGSTADGRNLLVPPRAAPRSVLHVAPKKTVTLRAPAKRTAKAAPKVEKPMPKPAPKPVASAPKPAPAPKPQPKKPVSVAKTTAPPPPPAQTAPPAPPKTSKAPAAAAVATAAPAKIEVKPGRAMRIGFDAANTKLTDADKPNLLALATAVRGKSDFRLQLLAYAGGKDLSTSKARRMSLSRALSVRSFLIENGIRSTQIDVRALGKKTTEKPVNRVDVNLARR